MAAEQLAMSFPGYRYRGFYSGARQLLDEVRQKGYPHSFKVTKVKEHRWNWILTMRYVVVDSTTGQQTVHRAALTNDKAREPLEAIREYLAAQERTV